jgi:hypothetical protein
MKKLIMVLAAFAAQSAQADIHCTDLKHSRLPISKLHIYEGVGNSAVAVLSPGFADQTVYSGKFIFNALNSKEYLLTAHDGKSVLITAKEVSDAPFPLPSKCGRGSCDQLPLPTPPTKLVAAFSTEGSSQNFNYCYGTL